MNRGLTRRVMLLGSAVVAAPPLFAGSARARAENESRFMLTNPTIDSVSFLEGDSFEMVAVAPSPWGLAVNDAGFAYVAGAQELSIVDCASKTVAGSYPYRTVIDSVGYGEYRAGGMGIAVTPDGSTVAVGLNLPGGNGVCEIFDVETSTFRGVVPIGVRPFDLVASPDSAWVYAIDHDSFTITAIELTSQLPTTIDAAPLGRGEFDKPHYAVVRSDGTLLLPYVGKLMWELVPWSGEATSLAMTANTHQHGVTLSDDESTAYIVGAGTAGPATGPPSLSILDLDNGAERTIELSLPHEQVALSVDGAAALLTGGYTFGDEGWDGVTRVDLETGTATVLEMPGRPLAIRRI